MECSIEKLPLGCLDCLFEVDDEADRESCDIRDLHHTTSGKVHPDIPSTRQVSNSSPPDRSAPTAAANDRFAAALPPYCAWLSVIGDGLSAIAREY